MQTEFNFYTLNNFGKPSSVLWIIKYSL